MIGGAGVRSRPSRSSIEIGMGADRGAEGAERRRAEHVVVASPNAVNVSDEWVSMPEGCRPHHTVLLCELRLD